MEQVQVQFKASLADIQSAIRIGKDGMVVQLEVPESEMANAIRLVQMRGTTLVVQVQTESQEAKQPEEAPLPFGAAE